MTCGVELVEPGGRLALLLERELGQRVGLIGQTARHQLVGDDAERVDVGPRAGLVAAGLLGRQVGGGAEHRADLGDARLVGGAGDPEVGQLDHVGVGDEQVAGLDVTVHDAVAVRVLEAPAGLGDDVQGLLDVEVAAVAQQLGAGVAGDVLHDDEVLVMARRQSRSRTPGRCWGARAARRPAPRDGSARRTSGHRPGARRAA